MSDVGFAGLDELFRIVAAIAALLTVAILAGIVALIVRARRRRGERR